MTTFVKFPSTPHLVWLGDAPPRADKVLSNGEVAEFLRGDLIAEEKVDGTNIGISVDDAGNLILQSRGTVLRRDEGHPHIKPLFRWVDERRWRIAEVLRQQLILFGEWCFARHSVSYTRLPDYFLAFDVYDRSNQQFWSADRREALVAELELASVPRLGAGHFHLPDLLGLIGQSKLGDSLMEGVYLRKDEPDFLKARSKIVRAEFQQAIDVHWSSRKIERNALASGRAW